jgi:hypothetical protein
VIDVTDVVQDWVDGTPNNGLLLKQETATGFQSYASSEDIVAHRPFLTISFASSNGPTDVILIRACTIVADTYIRMLEPNKKLGDSLKLWTGFKSGQEKQTLIRFEFEPCPLACRFTGGGVGTDMNWDHQTYEEGEMLRKNGEIDRAQFGGQAGAKTALDPQPSGEWTHHQQRGPSGRFTFHGGTSSAPEGTEIVDIRCSNPGTCSPSGDPPSPAKQLDFDGIGTFKSIGNGGNAPGWEDPTGELKVTAEGKGNKDFDGTFHWFEVNIDDLGEPGNKDQGGSCPDDGFGEKATVELADCDCPDFYRITIYNGVDAADVDFLPDGSIDLNSMLMGPGDVIYEFYAYIAGGNLQIHRLTGFDTK